ncbi:hypothetical protein DICVIV_04615, partial [Dictyocaulus viviparus]
MLMGKLREEVVTLKSEREEWKISSKKNEQLALEVERLETECIMREAEKNELETKIHELTCRIDQIKTENVLKIGELTEMLNISTRDATRYQEDLNKMQAALASGTVILFLIQESDRRAIAEHEMASMREQLLQNANLLASSHFSSASTMRNNQRCESLTFFGPESSASSLNTFCGDWDEIALILRQQQMISNLRMRSDHYQRENERLRSVLETSSLFESLEKGSSLRSYEAHKLQELESAYSRMKVEVERLVEEKTYAGVENMNVKLLLERIMEDNDRRREESAELRAILATRIERQLLIARTSPRPDSGHWSGGQSDDGSSDIEEDLCLERQCRQLKALSEDLNRVLIDRNREIERLEKRLSESTQTLVSSPTFSLVNTGGSQWWNAATASDSSERICVRPLSDFTVMFEIVLFAAPSIIAM